VRTGENLGHLGQHRDRHACRFGRRSGLGFLRQQLGDLVVAIFDERQQAVDDGSVLTVRGDAELLEPSGTLLHGRLCSREPSLLFVELGRARGQLG
jgi:hypothetical protein